MRRVASLLIPTSSSAWFGPDRALYKNLAEGITLPIGRGEWYWNPSRTIPPGPGNEITEFPFFTFLYSDLHAHMIVLMLALFVIAWALATVRARRTSLFSLVGGALVIGALYPTNLSDIYTYLPVGLTALVYAIWRAKDAPQMRWLPDLSPTGQTHYFDRFEPGRADRAFVLAVRAVSDAYSQAYSKLDPWTASRTPISSYLTHWGLYLFIIFSWLVWETRQWMAATPVSALKKLKPFQLLLELALALFIVLLLYLAYRKVSVGWIALPLGAWAGILMLRPKQSDMKRLALFWIGTALLITVVVELYTVRGDIGRMNTIFKFYLQAWTLLAVSGGAAFAWMLFDFHTWLPRWRNAWQTILIILFACAVLLHDHSHHRQGQRPHQRRCPAHARFDGIHGASEFWDTTVMDLSQDYRAIRWMQDNVQGSPVIVETNCPEYRWCSRFTIYTGLPGVVGWNWHQRQQRALLPPNLVTDRVDAIGNFYTTTDIVYARDFLAKYDVRYIVVGQLEEIYYPGDGLLKFEQYNGTLWKDVYSDTRRPSYEVISVTEPIIHLASNDAWLAAVEAGRIPRGQFVHGGLHPLLDHSQIVDVANTFYHGQHGLVLLVLDPDKLDAELKWEPPAEPEPTHAREGELFPHLYGPINLDAVTNVIPFEPDADGNFALPETLSG